MAQSPPQLASKAREADILTGAHSENSESGDDSDESHHRSLSNEDASEHLPYTTAEKLTWSCDHISKSQLPPWRDKNIVDKIPDVFTIDVDGAVGLESPELAAALCTCGWCQDWLKSIRQRYSNPLFCITATRNREDFDFYNSIHIHNWPCTANYIGSGRYLVPDRGRRLMLYQDKAAPDDEWHTEEAQSMSTDSESQWHMIVCIGQGNDRRTSGPGNGMVHILLPHDIVKVGQVIGDIHAFPHGFTVQAFSPDDPSAAQFPSTPAGVILDPTSSENWALAQSYLSTCRDEHESCKWRDAESTRIGFRPTRLIDVRGKTDLFVRLVDGPHATTGVGYLTLSYCWGRGSRQHCTTKESVSARYHLDGIILSQQPKTIQDAVKVARALGFQYLWVDSLCIIQDEATDVLKEIAQMDHIYQHASLLIAASRAIQAEDGFLEPVDQRFLDKELSFAVPFRYKCRDIQGYVLLQVWEPLEIMEEPLHTRAWTMQEHLLSKRILAFGASGMRWACLKSSKFGFRDHSTLQNEAEFLANESSIPIRKWKGNQSDETVNVDGGTGDKEEENSQKKKAADARDTKVVNRYDIFPITFDSSVSRDRSFSGQPIYLGWQEYNEWADFRNAYTKRDLSQAKDRLPAISAIAKQFEFAFGEKGPYLAGHWVSHLIRELPLSRGHRDRHGSFPTWSWASCNAGSSELVLDFRSDYFMIESARLHSAFITLVNPDDHYGDVEEGSLRLSARLMPIYLEFSKDEKGRFNAQERKPFLASPILPSSSDLVYATNDRDACSISLRLDVYFSAMDESSFWEEFGEDGDGRVDQPRFFMLEILERGNQAPSYADVTKGLLVRSRNTSDRNAKNTKNAETSENATENVSKNANGAKDAEDAKGAGGSEDSSDNEDADVKGYVRIGVYSVKDLRRGEGDGEQSARENPFSKHSFTTLDLF